MIIFSVLIFTLLLCHYNRGIAANSCYSANGTPLFCEPSLQNLAKQKPAFADNVCGMYGPEKVCTKWNDKFGNLQTSCEICDNSVTKQRHSPELVTDSHVRDTETCWLSEAMKTNEASKTVNLTVVLNKRSLISYLTLELCGEKPNGLIIYKRSHSEGSWIPWQYFSDNCQEMFDMDERSTDIIHGIDNMSRLKPVCFNLEKSIEYGEDVKIFRLLPFSPKQGRGFAPVLDIEQRDWLTASSVKFSYILQPNSEQGNYQAEMKPSHDVHIGASNVVIGGQPLCNGHSHRMILNADGTEQCECHHSTAGVDCELCHEEYNDQPWAPASANRISSCKRCECNNHAKKCNFDINVFMKSGGKHGSNCISCQDNTTGPQCDKCSVGYYRNHIYPIYHKNACMSCSCHPIGSYSERPCNPITGKCFCRPGVVGKTCNACGKGFEQTNSKEQPCKKDRLRAFVKKVSPKCRFCNSQPKKIHFKKFCRKEINLKVSVKSQESRGIWIRYDLYIENYWLHENSIANFEKVIFDGKQTVKVWVQKDLLDCECINLDFNRSYVIMTNITTKIFMGFKELLISEKSVVEEWNDKLSYQFEQFKNFESEGKCSQFKRGKRYARHRYSSGAGDENSYYPH